MFDWPIDRLGLLLNSDTGDEFVTAMGPFMAALGRGYLYDQSLPGVDVAEVIAIGINKEKAPRNGGFSVSRTGLEPVTG